MHSPSATQPLPRIAFCTTCKGRAQHLKKTLPQNLLDNADYPNCIFVVLDYNSPDDLQEFMHGYCGAAHNGRVAYYNYPAATAFSMAHAKNMAHRCGLLEGADILVNLDADGFTGRSEERRVGKECRSRWSPSH